MIKKPKRDLKVKSIYDQSADSSTITNESLSTPLSKVPEPQPVIIQSPLVQEIETQPIHQIVEHKQTHLPVEQNQPSNIPLIVQTTDTSNNLKQQVQFVSQPNLTKQPEFHPVVKEAQKLPVDSKKSKIQQLKQKYLKKNANINSQPTNNQTHVVPQEQKKQIVIQQPIATKIQHPQTITPPIVPVTKVQTSQINTKIESNITKQPKQQTKTDNHYQTDFKPLIEQRVKSKPPPPPAKRQIGVARNPFELKGTYTRPQVKQQIQKKVQPQIRDYQQNIPFTPYSQQTIQTSQLKQNQPVISNNPFDQYYKIDSQTTNNPFSPSSIIPIKPIPTVTEPSNLNLRYSNAVNHPQDFIKDLCLVNLLSEDILNIIQQKLYNKQSLKHNELNATSNHPQFNSWVSRLFTSLAIQSQIIDESNSQLVDDILNQFFLPLGQQFSPVFIVTLSKLPQKYYFKYQNYLVERSQLYINMIYQYSHLISPTKISQFLLFIQSHLNTSDPMYAENIIKTYLISPQSINENSLNNLIYNLIFPHAFVLLQILGKQKNKHIKQNLQIANIVIKQLEQNNQIQGGLELLKVLTQQLGTPAYTSLRQVRQRLISKYSQPQKTQTDTINQAKNVASNFFGFFSNAMDKIINKQPGQQQQQQQQQPEKPIQKQPQAKQSIYFDPIKKRYVLNGEIPDDEEEQVQIPIKEHTPPPPPISRGTPPPPPASSSIPVGNKKPNRILTNRYV